MQRIFTHHHHGPNDLIGGCDVVVVNDMKEACRGIEVSLFLLFISQKYKNRYVKNSRTIQGPSV